MKVHALVYQRFFTYQPRSTKNKKPLVENLSQVPAVRKGINKDN